MGVNMAGNCIIDDGACCEASLQEIIRRYYSARCDKRQGTGDGEVVYKIELLMNRAGIKPEDRPVVTACMARAGETGMPAAAISLPDGRVVTG